MAKDCTSDRVLLSNHMKEHWEQVGYKPDTQDLNDVDILEVQIGRKEPEISDQTILTNTHLSLSMVSLKQVKKLIYMTYLKKVDYLRIMKCHKSLKMTKMVRS